MPGIDKPTRRVVAVIVLLILVAAALRGYLPAHDRSTPVEPGGSRAALMFVVAALSATVALTAFAIIARLRDPRTVAPSAGNLSDMLGGGKRRPSWRVLLIGLAVIVVWLLIAMLLAGLFAPHDVGPSVPTPDSTTPPSPRKAAPSPPEQHPQNDSRDVFAILLAGTVPLMILLVAATAIAALRRRRRAAPGFVGEYAESPAPPPRSESLVRAAELGLAEMSDLSRDPREAIIACYAAMERELANVPGAVPQDFDTPTEVLARAVEHHALHTDNAAALVALFAEARFSPHVMNEGHREVAVRALRLVRDELGSRSAA
ncbi:DUF4129 domain-containing protein [Mycobacterium lacus]|uniref:Protein-glutamine gamma-glutamyltransferase-like C-terminal domain-containing protein n=1 Tax=Mycobacterium lacus TaxID=169765 RepID=A0A7I7NF26_9MYCO|nr:DUF4129 domain-containing protein [Mycobacterium lacus]MCV7124726.1 DUF4129 domain-containing protein [Mycobacterium lacus]BBX95272.1 hypothetical protein MLAC_05660 [Mycobacterium lacus]